MCVVILNGTVFSKTNRKYNKNNAKYDLKKYIVWCVRIVGDKNLLNNGIRINAESAPCQICVKRLLHFGFQKMAYTNQNGEMVTITLSDYTGYSSSSQMKCANKITI